MKELKQRFESAVILEDISPVFGSSESVLDKQIINATGDNSFLLPKEEMQVYRYFDSWNCVTFSMLNSIEAYFKYLISTNQISENNLTWLRRKQYLRSGEVNFSDRYSGAKAGTKIGVGNSGGRVKASIGYWGLVPEILWPMVKEMKPEQYYIKPPEELDELAAEFKKRFNINIESYWIRDIESVLKYSVPQVYVRAWYRNGSGLYYNDDPSKTNHAVVAFKKDNIFDSYDPYKKQLIEGYAYWPSGYFATVQEIVNENYMDIQKFLKDNDLLFVRNTDTGQFGRIMQGKLKIVVTPDRGTLMLLDEAVRTNGRGLSPEEWDALPSELF